MVFEKPHKTSSLLPCILVQLLVFVIITAIIYLAGFRNAPVIAVFTYFILSFLLKRLVPIYQTKGVALIRAGNIQGAFREFRKSYQFFTKYPWLDRYRVLLLLTVNTLSYTEMALLNVAYCHDLLGEKEKSKETYQEVLKQFPESLRAKAALKKYQTAEHED